jgi:hypothetical protein
MTLRLRAFCRSTRRGSARFERLVGKLALENEFLKGTSRHARQPTSGSTSTITGPVASQSRKDAG